MSVSTLSGAILVLVTFLIFSHHLWSGQRLCLTFEAPSGGPLEEQQPAHLTFYECFQRAPPTPTPNTHTHTNTLSRGTSTLRAGSSRPGVWCWHAGSAAVLGSPESWLASAACLYVYSCRLGWQRRADTCNLTCREWRWIVLLQTGQGLLSVGLCPVSLLHWVREQNPLKLLKKGKKSFFPVTATAAVTWIGIAKRLKIIFFVIISTWIAVSVSSVKPGHWKIYICVFDNHIYRILHDAALSVF